MGEIFYGRVKVGLGIIGSDIESLQARDVF